MTASAQAIEDIIRRELDVGADVPADDFAYNAMPAWTSSSHMNVVIALEDNYGIEFTPDEIVELTNLGEIVRIVNAKLGTASA